MAATATPPTTRSFPTRAGRWAVTIGWATLPLVAGPAFADALDPRDRAVQLVASGGLYVLWAVALGASLVPRTVSLTVLRIIVPAALPAVLWAAVATTGAGGTVGASALVGGAIALVVTVLALSSIIGDVFVNGSSYGDERRLPLRPPAALLIGPIELAWLVCVVGTVAGPMLLAAELWIAGGVALVVGWPATYAASRALHGLSQRWIVFVPAGFVLHDLLAVSEPVLMPRRLVSHIAPALEGTTATDFTQGSRGIVLQVDLGEPTGVTPALRRTRPGDRPSLESIDVTALLFAPSRPGAVLREAAARRFHVG